MKRLCRNNYSWVSTHVFVAMAICSCSYERELPLLEVEFGQDPEVTAESLQDFLPPLPRVIESPDNPRTAAKIDLGRILFFERRLSEDSTTSCQTCHDLQNYGRDLDVFTTSPGLDRSRRGLRNTPTVYNVAGHFSMFWDGRIKKIEHQAAAPLLNPMEMGFKTRQEVVQALATTPDYIELFTGAFPEDDEPLSFENICTALATFERGLTTPSRWDMFLKGDRNALTKDEIRGFFVFKEAGCARCHKGTYMGGQTFVRLGRVIPWPEEVDPGRFSVTRNKADYGKFKVPSLRNVTQTKPYLHDGREPSLKKVVEMMARHEKGRTLSKLQMNYLLQFLETLTGSLPLEYIREPDLPGNH